ncbi:T9SS type A sorting domain-containing protein [Psychroflexus sp. CAK8W]|uniref:T9SS type A sorting domain-containing protein n=1 Tax=Psychroflexus longus TaxID=2873596 RepID=A0ABS7XH40_9FLAO|nr:T9SS type A sorting domain-containing protein [Psychroflexus longus]MBZ9777421.1 T9SS type A sorting domain-containing protein [Psychroflexus longus]
MTGTFGDDDNIFLNLIFGWDLDRATNSSWAKNTANTAGTPFDDVSASSLPYLSATDAIKKNSVPNFTTMWGTDDNAVVAVIQYGAGYVIFMGWDFYNSGPGCFQYSHPWVQEVIPAALDYATELSDGSVDNISYTSADLTYSFSQSGQSYYVVVEDGSTPPTEAQIKAGVDYTGVTIADADEASTTASTDFIFNMSGLDYNTAYTVYVVTEYDNEGVTTFSQISDFNFTTLANDTPTISTIEDLSFCVGDSFTPINFTVSDEFPDTPLTVVAASSNTALIQDSDLTISNTGSDYQLTYAFIDEATGSTDITISATDGEGATTTEVFSITLNFLNISLENEAYILELNQPMTPIEVIENSSNSTSYSIAPSLPTGLSLDASTGTISGTPTVSFPTPTGFTITGTTTAGCSDTVNLSIGVNSKPEIDPIEDIAANCPNTDAVVDVTISDNETSANDLIVSASSSNTSLLNTFDISSTGATRTLTLTPEFDQTGTVTVTVTVEDEYGFTTQTSFDVTFIDENAPTAIAQNLTVELDETGSASITAAEVDNGSSDNCGVETLALDVTSFDCADLGENFVTLTVTDTSGNEATAIATVTVVDNSSPTAIAQNLTVELDETGSASITAAEVDNGSTDNCGVETLALDVTNFDCSSLGENLVTLTVTDTSGNEATATATVTVVDNLAPTITAPNDVIINTDLDLCSASNLNLGLPTIEENCESVFIEWDMENASVNQIEITPSFAKGIVQSAVLKGGQGIEDFAGNYVYVTRQFGSINKPVFDIVIDKGVFVNTFTFTHFHNHNFPKPTHPDYFAQLQVDIGGTGDFVDVGPPVFLSNATHTETDSIELGIYLPKGNNSFRFNAVGLNGTNTENDFFAVDNVKITSSSEIENDAPAVFPIGSTVVNWTATDSSGNQSTDTQTITVEDNSAPTAIAQNLTVELDETGSASITAAEIDNGSSDNCSIETLALDVTNFDCADLGENFVILTVTDSSGNQATATATVTVVDDSLPTAIAQNLTVEIDETGSASITAAEVDNGSSDNCGVETLALDVTSFDCADLGENFVTLTVTDASGNEATATATVTVVDNSLPTAIVQNLTVELDETGAASITADEVDNGSSDNCGIETLALDVTSFDCADLGENFVNLTATDASGNEASATAVVTVTETIAPTVLTQDIIVELDANGQASITADQIDAGSTDNCGIETLALDVTSFDCADLGENSVNLTATDASGNEATATATVTVVDNSAPSLEATGITVNLDDNDTVTILPVDLLVSVFDNCTVEEDITLSLDEDTFTMVGEYEVNLTATDAAGNSTTVAVIVIVDETLGVRDIGLDLDIKLYPNPASGSITIAGSNFRLEKVTIYDMSGRLVTTSKEVTIDVSDLSTGIYFAKVDGNDGKHSQMIKFVKK